MGQSKKLRMVCIIYQGSHLPISNIPILIFVVLKYLFISLPLAIINYILQFIYKSFHVDNYPNSTKHKFCGKSPFIRTVRHYTTSSKWLPILQTFKDLHEPENLERAKTSLKGKSGIYCIRHIFSGAIYIGQAQDIFVRILRHINGSTNTHLKRALSLYSLESFEFLVVEFVTDTVLLTAREQEHLDWLFSLPENLRYNFCPTAESRLGTTHSAETKALMSEGKSGDNHPMYGKTHTAESKALMAERKLGTTHTLKQKPK